MTNMSMRRSGDEIAELRAEIQKLKAGQVALSGKVGRRGRRRPLTLVGLAVLMVATMAGVAGASSGYGTTAVSFVPLSPVYKITTGVSIAAGKSVNYTVVGSPTPAPSDATTVQLLITVTDKNYGQMNIFPLGNSSGGDYMTWSAGVKTTTSVVVNVGAKNQVNFLNNSFGTAVVAITETGYSTQVTAADINGSGGTAGQVLTNTGTGASWQDAGGQGYAASISGPNGPITANDFNPQLIGSYTPPLGQYLVTFAGTVEDTSTTIGDFVQCFVSGQYSSIGSAIASVTPSARFASIAVTGMIDDSFGSGTINVYCSTGSAVGTFTNGNLDLVQVSKTNGDPAFGAPRK